MDAKQYLNQRKILHNHLLDFLDNQNDCEANFSILITYINNLKITENKNEFWIFLELILMISNNHHRSPNFMNKLDQVLSYFGPKIKQTFSNLEIFNTFSKNKRLLHFLIKNNIFENDDIYMNKITNQYFREYFLGENVSDPRHKEKKEAGENDLEICQIIREDQIDEFVIYTNQRNYSLKNKIKLSIYETNSFLKHKRELTLLEYAFFCGSIQIIKYLMINGLKLESKLWLFAIHSNNPEVIRLLEDDRIQLTEKEYQRCLEESVKCHHNEIASYISEYYIKDDKRIRRNPLIYSFKFFNYEKMAECELNSMFLLYACEYNYIELVKVLLNDEKIDINYTINDVLYNK
ncbi:hypothetical protein M9Y10_006228 [Tritrichomonas musculus]|uniref:DUF3447 domain-containing protein n=1 Tax=Tritrichomonas musculus TaxID=1915356 RepID=A0ABR2JE80_9EUKA